MPSVTFDKAPTAPQRRRSIRFYGTFVALCLLSFISALDVAIITTALPTITAEIGGAEKFIWIANSFVIASSVVQPLTGQLANLLGRRIPLITATVLFALGSGIAGGAHNPGMLIAGRTVQGVGAGAIYVLLDIVCSDLVPLRERGKYIGLMFSWAGLASALGPVMGGAIAQADWRWIFYLNIPVCALALGAILFFMRVQTGARDRDTNRVAKIWQLDILGNFIFIPSMISLLYGLVVGGIEHPWLSWQTILPLILGILGWIAFHIQQLFAPIPSIPARLFSNRTSATCFGLTLISSVTVQSCLYFLPLYFQAALGTTVLRSGINFLPYAICVLACAVLAGILLQKFGAYRPLHATSFALSAIGFGLFTLLDSRTTTVAWVFFQLIASAGAGIIMSVLLPAIMAALPESDVASASAAYSFIRTFGYIWGVTVPSVIFNAVFNDHLDRIPSLELREQLRDGKAYAFAAEAHNLRGTVDGEVWDAVGGVYSVSLRVIWWFGLGLSLLGGLLLGLEEGIELRTDLVTEYGMEEGKKDVEVELGEKKTAEAVKKVDEKENKVM